MTVSERARHGFLGMLSALWIFGYPAQTQTHDAAVPASDVRVSVSPRLDPLPVPEDMPTQLKELRRIEHALNSDRVGDFPSAEGYTRFRMSPQRWRRSDPQ